MQQAEEAAAEAETERGGSLHLVREAGVVEPQPAHGGAQVLELRGVDWEQAAEHHGDRRTEAGQRLVHRIALVGDGVADARVSDFLDRGGEHADLAGAELVDLREFGLEHADAVDLVVRVDADHADALALLEHAVDHAHQHDHAEIDVVPTIDQQGLQRRVAVALRRRQAGDDGLEHLGHVFAGLGRDLDRVRGVEADHVLDLLLDRFRLGGWQVDLVEHRHDLVAGVDGVVDVGERLRLDALAGVDHQERALAGGERAVDLIGEVDVARGVDQIEDVVLAVARPVIEPHGLRLDGDAALALDIHGIEHLLLHLARLEPAGELNQPVGKRRLAVVDVRDDGEIADVCDGNGRHGGEITLRAGSFKQSRRHSGTPRSGEPGIQSQNKGGAI